MSDFEFIDEDLKDGNGRDWIILDEFPASLGKKLTTFLVRRLGKIDWILLEEAFTHDLGFEMKSAAGWTVVDALHRSDRPEIERALKTLRKRFPEQRLIILGNGSLKEVRLGSYYGEGVYYADRELWADSGGDDRELLLHSRRLDPKYGLSDLVLGPKTQLKFQEVLSYIRTKSFCERQWGFKKRHSRGHGVTVLLHGDSGTGKTMAAEVLARELELPLYQVDLSSIMSKWVGETEKNLKMIFRAAKGVSGILLFDEGDAIFGARTEVKGSSDRYGNLEVNYLLQEIEAYDGVVVLSTNHVKNMDSAFLRRFTFSMTFGRPSPEQRLRIWQTNVPPEMPLGANVAFDQLARFILNGGNIKNCIREAAARAAGRGAAAVGQEDFLWAVKRELQKYGIELSREQVGETFWRRVAPEWEYKYFGSAPGGPLAVEGETA